MLTCEGCYCAVDPDKDEVVRTSFSGHAYRTGVRDLLEDLYLKRGEPLPPARDYHVVWRRPREYYWPALREKVLCGPLHEETEGEYYARWAGAR